MRLRTGNAPRTTPARALPRKVTLSDTLLVRALLARHGPDSVLVCAISDFKGSVSVACYVLGILRALLVSRWLGLALDAVVALLWPNPDLRIERGLAERKDQRAPARRIFLHGNIPGCSS